jgi:MOSC domain-containing protein YiiM
MLSAAPSLSGVWRPSEPVAALGRTSFEAARSYSLDCPGGAPPSLVCLWTASDYLHWTLAKYRNRPLFGRNLLTLFPNRVYGL